MNTKTSLESYSDVPLLTIVNSRNPLCHYTNEVFSREQIMTTNEVHSTIKPLVMTFMQELMNHYLGPLYHYLEENPELIKSAPGFLIDHEKLIVYIGRTHIGVEYIGSEIAKELKSEGRTALEYHDYSTKECNLFEQIIGFEYDSTSKLKIPLPSISEDLLLPTNRGWDKLHELGWNVSAQNSIMGFNTPAPVLLAGQFTRIVNGLFFDATDSGLKTRHIKWLDLFPIYFDGSDDEIDSIGFSLKNMAKLVVPDAHYEYPMPNDYKFVQLPKINRFIEIWGNTNSSEPEITSHLSKKENEFILTMRFGAIGVHSQTMCEWQSEERDNIQPDFFVVQPNGFADIVEFKLPNINKNTVVGIHNRETFSAWLHSYVAQTRVYSIYFDDPNNRSWFENKYGFKVYKPRRWLVVGRRGDFSSDIWREIMADYQGLEIMTYDDLIDGVVAQFYK